MITQEKYSKQSKQRKYAFDQLNVDDCLTIIVQKGEDSRNLRNKVSTSLYFFKRNNKLEWKTRVINKGNSIKVYRIA